VQYLENSQTGDGLILHDNKLSYFPMLFYAPFLDQTYLGDEPGSHNDTLALTSQEVMGLMAEFDMDKIDMDRNIYFVVFEKALQEYEEENLAHPHVLKLQEDHLLSEVLYFGDLIIYHFEVIR
jgi:hypothetical protein